MATQQPLSEDIRDWLSQNITRFIDDDDHNDIELIGAPQATTLNGRPAALLPVKVNRHIYMLAAVQSGDQAVLLGFRGAGSDVEDMDESLETFASDVLPFWETLEFIAPGDSGLLPAATPGVMSGILRGFTSGLEMQISGMAELRIRHTTIVFYEDGHFYDGTPPKERPDWTGRRCSPPQTPIIASTPDAAGT